MTIGILETGRPPVALRAQWGTYDDMVRSLLGRDRDYRTYDVQAGELPAEPTECAAYVITGSSAGVYDDLPWIPPFLDFLRRVRGHAKLVGICFGHQAMAQAFGGTVEKSPKGWGLGMHRYEIVEPPPGMREPLGFAIPAFHQDQVVTLPPGARVLAASEFTPIAAIGYDDNTVSLQGHPEFSPAFSAALIKTQHHIYGDLAAPALLSLLQPEDSGRAADWLRTFVDGGGLDTPG
ncbi:type 1 glutamine amidotransferase [Acidisphaera sp. L21]|uniref:type 1 glutamine amidotransferase n=1 Tax=Acidisphaera sp. L21 TaxID=1641851 RepID=UPI00131B6307|nr:type 1 glutamine amidotransferase [Acidisphaera sp. L21]